MKRSTKRWQQTAASRRGILTALLVISGMAPLATTRATGTGGTEPPVKFVMDKNESAKLQLMLFLHRAEPDPALAIPARTRAAESGDDRKRH